MRPSASSLHIVQGLTLVGCCELRRDGAGLSHPLALLRAKVRKKPVGNFVEGGILPPRPERAQPAFAQLQQLFGGEVQESHREMLPEATAQALDLIATRLVKPGLTLASALSPLTDRDQI